MNNIKEIDCDSILESLRRVFLLQTQKKLESKKNQIGRHYQKAGMSTSSPYRKAILQAEFEHKEQLFNHLVETIKKDFSNIPLSNFKKKLLAVVEEEYNKMIPITEDLGKDSGSSPGLRKLVTNQKEKAKTIVEAKCEISKGKVSMIQNTVFISHAAEDAVLAKIVKTQIDNVFEKKVNVFVSSIPGTISPGSDWLDKIIGNLMENNAFIVLVTPYSEKRPFVWFEIGFSWLRRLNKNCEIYAICAPPIDTGNLPEPLCRLQATSLAIEKQTRAFFDKLTKQFKLGNLDALEFAKVRDSLPTYPSQITQTENIDISDEAKELLIEASQSPDGRIMRRRTMQGLIIETNKKGFVGERNARLEAIWEDALKQLIENRLIEDKGYKGEVFAVTRLGYEYADTLKKDADILQDKSSAGTSTSVQQDDLEFEKTSGTYISKENGNRYCPKCLHSSSQRVPLKEQKNGWRCNVCDTFYPNPNYNPSRPANYDHNPLDISNL